jgi:HlyD family secretion protein
MNGNVMNKPLKADALNPEPTAPVLLKPTSPETAPVVNLTRRRWLIAGALIVAVLAAIALARWYFAASGSVHYSTAPVTRGAVTRTVTATGTVNPVLTIIVGTYVSGVIQELHCDYNTQVKVGQVCAKIDPRPYQTVVDQSEANLLQAKAQLEKDQATLAYAQLTYERNEKLVQTSAVSKDALDNSRSAFDQARAQIGVDEATIAQRQAQLESARVNLGYTDIISPVDGTVVSRNVTVGQTVAASFQTPTLFLIATDLTKMQVDTNVSESDIGGIKEGEKGLFTVDAFPKRTFEGLVTQVRQSPQTVQNVVTYDVVVSVDNTDLSLKPGMTAANRIVTDQRNDVLRVPSQALRYVPAGVSTRSGAPGNTERVFVLRDDRPVAVPVTAGLDDDTYTEIVQGDIKLDDLVIVGEQRDAGRSAVPRPRF